MAKVNISLPDGLLDEVDRRAGAADTTRSAFIQEAAARYIASLDRETEYAARSERIGAAIAKMRAVSGRVPPGASGSGGRLPRAGSSRRWADCALYI